MNWTFHMTTRVFGGRGCICAHGAHLSGVGKRALIVTGRHGARACGALADVTAVLSAAGIHFAVFDAVEPNPSVDTVRRAADRARTERADFVIGIGGGSPLDAAKAVALLATNLLDDAALFAGGWPNAPLPVIAVPTTAGTGSEVTQYAILTDNRLQSKRNLASPALFPVLAYCDPAYTDALPRTVTIHTGIDAFSHALEGFVSARSMPDTDPIAREALGLLGSGLRQLAAGAPDAALRDRLMLGSTLGGMVIAHTGTTALHAMGYSLTYFRNIDHGRANGLLMAPWLAFVAAHAPERVTDALAATGFGSLAELDGLLSVLLGEKEVLSEEEIHRFAGISAKAGNLPNSLRLPSFEDLAGLYRTLASA
mgnify:FL=1